MPHVPWLDGPIRADGEDPLSLTHSVGSTSDSTESTRVLPTSRGIKHAADGFQNAAEASLFALAVAPAIAFPIFAAPCSTI